MGAHALLAPSSAKRWMTCAPSARLEAQVPEKDTAYTREGTIAHAMAENILTFYLSVEAGGADFFEEYDVFKSCAVSVIREQIAECEAEGLDWDEMAQTVYENYCRPVYETYLAAKTNDPEAVLMVEAKLKLGQFIPEGFGSSDAVIIHNSTLEVFDLKYGKGVKVNAENNPQMMCYALGAFCAQDEFYDITDVRMTIIQPRLRHDSSWSLPATDLIDWAAYVLQPAALKAWEGTGRQVPGEHCRFCKVAARCKALAAYTLDVTANKTEPGLMSMEEVAALLPTFGTIKNWIASVEDFALEAALDGTEVPGFKVVEGRSVRKISNPALAIERLELSGIDPSSFLRPAELKTISDLEKTLTKKGFTAILGDLVIKPEGKPTLVEDTDPRPAYSRAATDFKDLL